MKINKDIKTRMRRFVLDDAGDVAIEVIVKMMLAMFLIYLFIQIMPIVTIHTNMSHVADDLTRTVELTGQLNSTEYQNQMTAYKAAFPFMNTATVTIAPDNPTTGWFSQAQGKLAFRAPFTLRMSYTYRLSLLRPTLTDSDVGIDVPISKIVYGTAEIYWKE